jgi:hypothetical protein
MVPRGVEDVDEADAALDQTTGQETVRGEVAVLSWAAIAANADRRIGAIDAVHF